MNLERAKRLGYAPLLAMAMGFMMLRTLIVAHFLPLNEFANYSTGLLISGSFCMLACLGLQPLLQREMPVMMVRGRFKSSAALLAQCIVVASGCAALALVLAFAGVRAPSFPVHVTLLGLMHGLSQQCFIIATIESRSRWETMRYAYQNLARGLAVVMISTLLADFTRAAYPILVAEIIITLSLAQLILWKAFRRIGFRYISAIRLALNRFRRVQWKAAATLLLISVITFALLNVDRWAANQFLSSTRFALYSFAAIILVISGATQVLINASAYPMLARRFAANGAMAAFRVSWKLSVGLGVAGIVAYGPAYLALTAGTRLLYPQYAESAGLMAIFLVVGILRISDFWSSFLVITGQESRLLLLNVLSVILGLTTWVVWAQPWRDSPSPIDVAMLALVLNVFSYLLVSTTAFRFCRGKNKG
ncbi:hypothetical protein ERD78_14185 [Allopusillimonas soli]|uniref:O-antigen/teichoic acid export membrane protein n=1 Tax=Allopusillimonas soli TaxID=659016 RepID=A0A853FDL6_9BURK|nr:hypothetical protein [Allopusillimonas soli]NYT38027.1 hypothetical protein [Allopusillimonas soli]TEA73919.1 hypothetical protein ERD78_14185 [Allopusillimonas soli]